MSKTPGSFKEGTTIRNTGRTRFKKGISPWNKGKTGVYYKETLRVMAVRKVGKKNPHTIEQNKKIGDSQRGNKGNNWKGGITQELVKARNSVEYSKWSGSVLSRDNFTCQKYGTTGGKLHAHHILNFSSNPELRFDIDNGVTLSKRAHKEFHKKYGHKNNTKEQINEFLGIQTRTVIE